MGACNGKSSTPVKPFTHSENDKEKEKETGEDGTSSNATDQKDSQKKKSKPAKRRKLDKMQGKMLTVFAFESLQQHLVEKGVEPSIEKDRGIFEMKMMRPLWKTDQIRSWLVEIDDVCWVAVRMTTCDNERVNRRFVFHNAATRAEVQAQDEVLVVCTTKTSEVWALAQVPIDLALDLEEMGDLKEMDDQKTRVPWFDIALTQPAKVEPNRRGSQSQAVEGSSSVVISSSAGGNKKRRRQR